MGGLYVFTTRFSGHTPEHAACLAPLEGAANLGEVVHLSHERLELAPRVAGGQHLLRQVVLRPDDCMHAHTFRLTGPSPMYNSGVHEVNCARGARLSSPRALYDTPLRNV